MGDTYLIANAPYGATDVLLVTSASSGSVTTATAGGNLRRHMGKSAGHPRQVQRFVRFRWSLTITVNGDTTTAVRITAPAVTAKFTVTAVTALRPARLTTTGHLAARAALHPPPVRLLNLDDEDELLLLLL